MDASFQEKRRIILNGKNGGNTLEILNMAAYFTDGNIRISLFSPLISDRSELMAAVHSLRRLLLVKCHEDSFTVPNSTSAMLREHFKSEDEEESVLKQAILLLNKTEYHETSHFNSVYTYSKSYPQLHGDLGKLPKLIVSGLVKRGKFTEALEFGADCYNLLSRSLGECHRTVIDLQLALGFAFVAVNEQEQSISVLTDVYDKMCLVDMEEEERSSTLFILAHLVIGDDTLAVVSEVRLRRIVFKGQKISETTDGLSFEKWVRYAQVITQFGLSGVAVSILDRVIEVRRDVFGPGDEGVVEAMHVKAQCLIADRWLTEAMDILKKVQKKREAMHGASDLKTMSVLIDVGDILIFRERHREAMKVLGNFADDARRENSDESNELFWKALSKMIRICIRQRSFEKALELCTELHEKLVSVYGDVQHEKCFECRRTMGDIFFQMGRPQKALRVFHELLEKYDNTSAPPPCMEDLHTSISSINKNLFSAVRGTVHWYAKRGDLERVMSLIADGDIEEKDTKGFTPLHYASAFGRNKVVKALIRKGARYDSPSPLGETTPLLVARGQVKKILKTVHFFFESAKADDVDQLEEIASKEPCVTGARDVQGCTPLHWAALRGYVGTLRTLLELGVDPAVVSDKGNSPLHVAALKGNVQVSETLLNSLEPDKRIVLLDGRTGHGGNTPLHAAVEKGQAAMVKSLLSHGADWGARNAAGKTPLQVMSKDCGCKDILVLIEELFDQSDIEDKLRGLKAEDMRAVVGAKNRYHRTLTSMETERKHFELVEELEKITLNCTD